MNGWKINKKIFENTPDHSGQAGQLAGLSGVLGTFQDWEQLKTNSNQFRQPGTGIKWNHYVKWLQ